MAKVRVVLSHRPDEPVVMNEDEVPQVRHQGLVVSVTPADTDGASAGAPSGKSAGAKPDKPSTERNTPS